MLIIPLILSIGCSNAEIKYGESGDDNSHLRSPQIPSNISSGQDSIFCENEIKLIKAIDTLQSIEIDFNLTREGIYSQIDSKIINAKSLPIYDFTIPFNYKIDSVNSNNQLIDLRVIVEKPLSDGCVLYPQRIFEILVNKNNQLLINTSIGNIDSLVNKLSLHYDDTSRGFKKFIAIQWDNGCDKKELQKIFKAIIDGQINASSKYAHIMFDKEICDLTPIQLDSVKQRVPFNLNLFLISHTPPPPPPAPKY